MKTLLLCGKKQWPVNKRRNSRLAHTYQWGIRAYTVYAYTRIGLTHIMRMFWFRYIWAASAVTYFHKGLTKVSNTQGVDINCYSFTELLLSFESPAVMLFSIPVKKLLLCEWILSTKGNFIHSIRRKSSLLGHKRCYGLRPLMAAPVHCKCYKKYKTLTTREPQISTMYRVISVDSSCFTF